PSLFYLRSVALSLASSVASLFNDPATTALYTLSLHDALPIFHERLGPDRLLGGHVVLDDGAKHGQLAVVEQGLTSLSLGNAALGTLCSRVPSVRSAPVRCDDTMRSEEHTSELQSRENLVCRLLLEKKKEKNK